MELMEAIKGRRSIRKYKADAPSDEDLNFILEAAQWAPSWANTQCWEFIIVRDAETKQKLAETLPEKNPARPAIGQAPVVIAACALKEKAGYFKDKPATDKGDWLLFDTALALQNLTLAAYSRGLGTVHVGFFDSQKAEEILKVPASAAVVELLPLGYPDGEAKVTPRKQIEDFVFFDCYGKKGK
jgi:nitroreductase